ncbi:MAG TPA: hypothetical protein VGM09_09470 [Bradyrhizobium sp.]|jgi:hypothetical protein
MRSFWATQIFSSPANPQFQSYSTWIHPALTSFADECCGTLARLLAYVGALALLAIVGIHLWDQLPDVALEPAVQAGWSVANRSYPAFSISQAEFAGKTDTYEILRHPLGGRKDIMRWAGTGERPTVEVEIYRPGGELSQTEPAIADLADRMDRGGIHELEAAGIVDSKFGSVTLLRLTGRANDASACLGFMKNLENPALRISGWTCQGESLPARRVAVGCMLNRLILLTAGNEPKLAELFARAELKRGGCGPAASASWVTDAENPKLRGAL